ncbi:MAG: mechanosensitive ion channel family protein [Gemmataceae bacterium]|nr:mechanosensitive ion channel family protein [Gemmataceae bacterium]
MDFLDRGLFGNTARSWLIALGLATVAVLTLRVVTGTLVRKIGALAERTATFWDDVLAGVLRSTKGLSYAIVVLLVIVTVLSLPTDWETTLRRVAAVALVIQGGFWAAAGLTGWLAGYRRTRLADDPAAATTVTAIGFVGRLVLWAVVLLLALDNLGVDVTALVAGLGVGGVAVALAAQNILGDLFASMSIVLDKPFVMGDFIIVNEYMGTVEHVGLKTTRVRSLTGEQLVFSNNDLLQSRIRNFGRMKERRILFTVGVVYQTPRQTLARIPDLLKRAVEAEERTRLDRAHFRGFGDSTLDFEVVYYMKVPDYNTYMDVQQAINLRIVEQFESEGIEFAYPTRTIFLEKSGVEH